MAVKIPTAVPAPPSAARQRRARPTHVRSETQIRKMCLHGTAMGLNPLTTSQAGILRLKGLLTDRHLATVDFIGHTYGRFEQLVGRKRRTASPSYEYGTRRGERESNEIPDTADDPKAPARALSQLEEAIVTAREAYTELQDQIDAILVGRTPIDHKANLSDHGRAWRVARAREVIERLCVDDHAVPYWCLNDLVDFLDRLWIAIQTGKEKKQRAAPSHVQPLRASQHELIVEMARRQKRAKKAPPAPPQIPTDTTAHVRAALLTKDAPK